MFAERLMQENPDAFVTADEIGCGIVPMEAFERDYRETDGRIYSGFAAYSGGSAPGYLRSGKCGSNKRVKLGVDKMTAISEVLAGNIEIRMIGLIWQLCWQVIF